MCLAGLDLRLRDDVGEDPSGRDLLHKDCGCLKQRPRLLFPRVNLDHSEDAESCAWSR